MHGPGSGRRTRAASTDTRGDTDQEASMAGRQRDQSPHGWLRLGLPLVGAFCLAALLRELFPAAGMTRWVVHPAAVAGLCWAGQLWYVGRSIDANRFARDPWHRPFGLANTLTLLRGGLYAVVAGFVVVPATTDLAWVPALCYGSGVVLDKLDGTVARTVGRETALGRRLDMAFDTFGFVAAPVVAVLWGQLPVWYLSLSAARYVFLAGVYWRRVRGRPVFDTPDSNLGKYLAGVQMVFVTMALAPAVSTALVWTLAPAVLAPSLAVFARDFLAVSGRLPHVIPGGQN
ncbi:CDP-alcohol phosphatidyltransferase family protein [Haloterrigena longa]|uniref:CDP-alcohol phosphatidyltransferase family protein n=2 Tax=Natrinema longum TaxID=370324 RepID=A0A8A2UB20_9EURY|nr:CDP-alcohol phosphatidyltransferase family protein [Natrinema longum]MBZ6496135.1 CDP-alcohol phosphatidyltransferase family protein [Natrinema longum]QSW85939.1 CDP-alcohol phosphatidyltransferase family protein [Natrinema longum]